MAKVLRLFVLIGVFLLVFLWPVEHAGAEQGKIQITVKPGFDGKVKNGKGFPVIIKVENHGKAFSGDLLIDYVPSDYAGGSKKIHIELPENEIKTYSITLPGLTNNSSAYFQNQKMIRLYEGDWMKGKEVAFSGDKKLTPKFIESDYKTIGVLSENYDRLKELRGLSSSNFDIIPLKKEEIPQEAQGLEMIDYIIIDEYPLSQLTESQQQAIKDWIQSGGTLFAGGAPDGKGIYGTLYSLLPMKPESEHTGSAGFLDTSGKQIPFGTILLFTGEVDKEAEILAESNGLPAIIKKTYGEGLILQTAFSLGDQPLSAWDGYRLWFEDLLKNVTVSTSTGYWPMEDFYYHLYRELGEPNEYFPFSQYSLPVLIVLMLVYIILIVPVLYLLLKKIDKREYTWWIIPSVGLLTALGVFAFGAKDRIARPQLNQMGVYQMTDEYLSGWQATTMLSNKSGNYRLSVPKGEFLVISSTFDTFDRNMEMAGVIEEKRKTSEIIFKDVPYWSAKTVFGKAQKYNDGSFFTDLTLKNGKLTGVIENRFPYDFDEVFIWSGNTKIDLGSLKQGEKKKIDKKITQKFLFRPEMLSGSHYYDHDDLEEFKKERLETAAASLLFTDSTNEQNKPFIGGVTADSVIDVKLVNKKQKENNWNLIVAPLTVKNEITGQFALTVDMFEIKVKDLSGNYYNREMDKYREEIWIDNGEYELILTFPGDLEGKPVTFESINILLRNSADIEFSIFNWETGEYMLLESGKPSLKLTKENQAGNYISENGEIVFKINKNTEDDMPLVVPEITVKGEVES